MSSSSAHRPLRTSEKPKNANFAFSGFSEVRPEPLRRAAVVPIPPAALALETLFVLLAVGHGWAF
jgi:hypothetical protein